MHLRNRIANAFRRKVLLGGNMHQDYRRLVAFAGALALLVVLIPTPATAQNRIIKGKVINEKGDPIEGATVAIQGTVRQQCTAMGCYFFFLSGKTMLRVELQEIAMTAPRKNGHLSRVEGQIRSTRDDHVGFSAVWPKHANHVHAEGRPTGPLQDGGAAVARVRPC